MDAVTTAALVPPRPRTPERELAFLPFLRAIRGNALTMWTERAYQEPVLVRRLVTRLLAIVPAMVVVTLTGARAARQAVLKSWAARRVTW